MKAARREECRSTTSRPRLSHSATSEPQFDRSNLSAASYASRHTMRQSQTYISIHEIEDIINSQSGSASGC